MRHLADPLHLKRLEKVLAKIGVLQKLCTDPLDDPFHLGEIGVEGQVKGEFLDHPVTTVIGNPRDLPERQRVHGAAVMSQPQAANRYTLDGASDVPDLDVL